VEWGGGCTWTDPAEDEERLAAARSYAALMEPFASGVYVNMLSDEGEAGVRRAYSEPKWRRLADLKARFDPDNVFHLNANIAPSGATTASIAEAGVALDGRHPRGRSNRPWCCML